MSSIRNQKGEQKPVSINQHGMGAPDILLPCMILVVIKLSYVMRAGTRAAAKIRSVLSVFRSISIAEYFM